MVFPPYAGLIAGSGPPPHNMLEKPLVGSPNKATAATWSATGGRHLVAGQIDHGRALRIPAKHDFRVGAGGDNVLDVGTGVIGTGGRAVVVIVVRRVVDR